MGWFLGARSNGELLGVAAIYYVMATAWLNVHTGDTVGQCYSRNGSTGADFE
jgi:hypothetical protein